MKTIFPEHFFFSNVAELVKKAGKIEEFCIYGEYLS
jgi:hypothetical protein